MNYRGFIIQPHYSVGSDFTVKNGQVIDRKPTKKDIEYYDILDPMEDMRKHCAESTLEECKETIDKLLKLLNMKSNLPCEWAKLD